MILKFNKSQREALSDFFRDIAVAWFVGFFVVAKLSSDFDTLTFFKYLANMIGYLFIALLLRKE